VSKIQGFEVAPSVFEPLILVTMRLNGQESEKLCLVDSGADGSLVSSEWLAECGVGYADLQDPITAQSANDAMEIRPVYAELVYEGVAFATMFMASDPGPKNPLLGRNDFFQHFAVNFSGWLLDPPYFRADKKK
jgi:hypothetical protein